MSTSEMPRTETVTDNDDDAGGDRTTVAVPVSIDEEKEHRKLQGKLLKQLRQVALEYDMLNDGDHIMVCVSGGKDSATLLYLLKELQQRLPVSFQLTAVHVDQKQPGYNGTSLVQWLEHDMKVPFHVVEEDTYSIVVDKTKDGKSYCPVCSRMRRGILYTTAMKLGCNKIALGHHADDAMETLLLNMIHGGQMKGMPARYTAQRGNLGVLRPLMGSFEEDIAKFAQYKQFPILPCNLCSNQANLQRPQVKLLVSTLSSLNPNAKRNLLTAMQNVRPTHLLDTTLREACGLDPITGQISQDRQSEVSDAIGAWMVEEDNDDENTP
eukprot:CAMPEP_0195287796 /NCGR_PEP_ID=MMETSP0707-20130614/4717_1 /TAXON_ID=33640 /ORGANISM="Asterionellopsis glacialis, Strain CCMP134" /LENGTH=323 /DNA_ID=CAMNT_0040347587 /DNA_START=260 /DNA_END=1227 /DNA_ORIENTATION=+